MLFPGPSAYAGFLLRPLLVLSCLLSVTLTSQATRLDTGLGYALSHEDQKVYTKALNLAQRGRWKQAERLSQGAHDPILIDYIRWRRLADSQTQPSFEDIRQFLSSHPGWPFQGILHRKAEHALEKNTPPLVVIRWLVAHPPKTGRGLLRLAQALYQTGQKERARHLARRAWIEKDLSRTDEKELISQFGHVLQQRDHEQRLDNRLWDGDIRAAKRLLDIRKLSPGVVSLAKARIALQRRRSPVDRRVRNVPASYKNDSGLLFDRLVFRRLSHGPQEAAQILLYPSADKKRPDLWARERLILARSFLEQGHPKQAYMAARHHHLKKGPTYVELEWLSGWIALRFLNAPQDALRHFQSFSRAVGYPISVARAHYWMGRTFDALSKKQHARRAYERATQYPTTFYGQIASRIIHREALLPSSPEPHKHDHEFVERNPLTPIVASLAALERNDDIYPFFIRLFENAATEGQRAAVLQFSRNVGGKEFGVALARRAALKGHHDIGCAYPLPEEITLPHHPEQALILAVIRQESNFKVDAVSRAGAKGLMQLLPSTARSVARKKGVRFRHHDLKSNPNLNVTLGSSYLSNLIKKFKGSYALAVASYNAGPRNTKRWIRQYGDPRHPKTDLIDWIEQIPFGETRNYVQRVLETTYVYRKILGVDYKQFSTHRTPTFPYSRAHSHSALLEKP